MQKGKTPLVKTIAVDNETWKKIKELQLAWDKKTAEDVIKELLSHEKTRAKA